MRDVLLVTLILFAAALIVLVLAAVFIGWKVLSSDERKLARRIGKLRFGDKLRLGRDLFTDPRVPLWARLVGIALVAYLASPIDLVPEFIPVLGVLDDLLVAMLGAGFLLRAVPRHVIEEHVAAYERKRADGALPPGKRVS